MNLSFNEIKQLIEHSVKGSIRSSLKFSSYLLLFISCFVFISLMFVNLKLFDSYFTIIFKTLKIVGVTEELAKIIFIFTLTLILYFVIAWIGIKMSNNFWAKRKYKWSPENDLYDFDFQGNIVVDAQEQAIHIIKSELGCIVKNRNWKNFQMKFDFMIPKVPTMSPKEDDQKGQLRRGFGIIYRADSLGKYYMLKIDSNGYLPHVRNILWENNGKIFNTSLAKNDLDKWISAKLSMADNFLSVSIGIDKFSFLIPTHSSVHKDTRFRIGEESDSAPYSKIPFREYGSVGFRSAPFEEVYIRNLAVSEEYTYKYIRRKIKRFFHFD